MSESHGQADGRRPAERGDRGRTVIDRSETPDVMIETELCARDAQEIIFPHPTISERRRAPIQVQGPGETPSSHRRAKETPANPAIAPLISAARRTTRETSMPTVSGASSGG